MRHLGGCENMLDQLIIDKSIKEAFNFWDHPSIPEPIYKDIYSKEINLLELEHNFAFMEYPSYQIYLNLEKIVSTFENPERALKAITKHEFGHRFVPYDAATSVILGHFVVKSLKDKVKDYIMSYETPNTILNLFTDMCINTSLVNKGDEDIIYLYRQLTKESCPDLWKVYTRSMEKAWNVSLFPKKINLRPNLESAAQNISNLFRENILNKEKWNSKISEFAINIYKFLDYETICLIPLIDPLSTNFPKELNDKLKEDLVKRYRKDIDSLNINNMKDLMDMMSESESGYNHLKSASIRFYDLASQYYTVRFAKKSFEGAREGKFQPIKWNPSMGADKLDVEYSLTSGGRIIPSITTYAWKCKKRKESLIKENILNLDLYIDSSMSMPNPLFEVSLPVLAGFVVSKMAHKKGARISVTNFSEDYIVQESTTNLSDVFEKIVIFQGGGTQFPIHELTNIEKKDPRLIMIVTDTFLSNLESTLETITKLRKKGNLVCIYGISEVIYKQEFEKAGAQVVHGVTTDIFREMVGKTFEAYER